MAHRKQYRITQDLDPDWQILEGGIFAYNQYTKQYEHNTPLGYTVVYTKEEISTVEVLEEIDRQREYQRSYYLRVTKPKRDQRIVAKYLAELEVINE